MKVGQIVIAKHKSFVCEVGEVGVCYEHYTLDNEGYSIIFASGRYDGFNAREVEKFLTVTSTVDYNVSTYEFTNVMNLDKDFNRGHFQSAFDQGKAIVDTLKSLPADETPVGYVTREEFMAYVKGAAEREMKLLDLLTSIQKTVGDLVDAVGVISQWPANPKIAANKGPFHAS